MADGLTWSAAQWERVNREVTEAFEKANVVGKFLPKYGPLPESAEYVKDETLDYALDDDVDPGSPGTQLSVKDDTTLKLFTLSVHVVLSREQVSEESLSSALLAFRRASNMLAQAEDHLVFTGHDKAKVDKAIEDRRAAEDARTEAEDELAEANEELAAATKARQSALQGSNADLVKAAREEGAAQDKVDAAKVALKQRRDAESKAVANQRDQVVNQSLQNPSRAGLVEKSKFKNEQVGNPAAQNADEQLVSAVAKATTQLENDFHPGPFACVLGTTLFALAHKPTGDMVLPAERIKALLDGTSATANSAQRLLFQCGQLPPENGIVVALAGGDIDLVVATPPRVELLQVNVRAKYVFRVYEKFIWRIKDPRAVVVLHP